MKIRSLSVILAVLYASLSFGQQSNEDTMWCEYIPKDGPGKGKHVVLIAGDDEYRSEEALPMLGKILARRHGFRCTVLFPVNDEGKIQPDYQKKIPGMHHLKNADLVVLGLRFRNLPDKDMQYFDEYLESGKPIIAVRTSTHAFNIPSDSEYAKYSFNSKKDWKGGFGKQVLGETWVSHHGKHGKQSTRGIVNKKTADHPILNSVNDVWGPTDVYAISRLPKSAKVLLYGQVLDGMKPESEPVPGKVNDPMMPLAWTTTYRSRSGKPNRIFCTTMGSSTDFQSADLRRLIVNAVYWCLEMESSEAANVDYVDTYQPTNFGFGSYQKHRTPAYYDLKK